MSRRLAILGATGAVGSTLVGHVGTAGAEGVGATVASGARFLGPRVAIALGEVAANNVAKVVPFALAVQGLIASKDAYDSYAACAAGH